MKRSLAMVMIITVLCALLASCAKSNTPPDGDIPPAPADGFVSSGDINGGGTVADANINSLIASEKDDIITLEFDFLSGSRLSGATDERGVKNVPRYRIYMLESPYRLVVEFDSIAYWDFERNLDFSETSFVLGAFKHIITSASSNLSLFIQLGGPAYYKAEEDGSKLNITLMEISTSNSDDELSNNNPDEPTDVFAAEDGEQFYIVANAYRDYCNGTISREMDMQPVLSADLKTVQLISKPFVMLTSAEAFLSRTLSLTDNAVASAWSVVPLKDGELPPYSEEMNYMAAYDEFVVSINGKESTLPVLIPNGHILALMPDKSGYLYSKRIMLTDMTNQYYTYEQLCVQNEDGTSKELFRFEFATIERASFSPDGRKLAVLERADEATHLYVFDVDTRELLTDLSGAGFGDMISTFEWDSMGSVVFSIGGSSEIVVHQYDFNVPSENMRHSYVDRKGADESSLGFLNGEVYFVESQLDTGAMIYRIKPEGGVRRSFLPGSAFAISSNGLYMAVVSSGADYFTGVASETGLFIHNMETGEKTTVQSDFTAYNCSWSWDCTRLFYFENRLSGGANEGTNEGEDGEDSITSPPNELQGYAYTLWMYDLASGETRTVADLPYTSVIASRENNILFFNYYDAASMGETVRATYVITIG